jgi:hypothetical protein
VKKLIRLYEWSELNPMRVHTLLFAIRDVVYGMMIVFGVPDVKHSSLYGQLSVWHAAMLFGLSLTLAGTVAGVGTVWRSSRITSASLATSAWFWLFVSMSFVASHNPAAGMMFLFGFAFTTAYIGYRYKWSRNNRVVLNPHGEYQKEQL